MYPEIVHWHLPFHLPLVGDQIVIHSYGLMMVVAFFGCQWLGSYLAKRKGYNPEVFVNATLVGLVAGVIGSRMSHVLENLSDYTRPDLSARENFFNMINITSGGLTFYGGLILAAPVVASYFVWKKIPLRSAMDICAPVIMLGLSIGRIGCFLNGCCYGAETNLPWAVEFPYGSNAYLEAVSDGKIIPPDVLYVPRPDGKQRLITTDELRTGQIVTGIAQLPKIPVTPDMQKAAATARSHGVHPAELYSTLNSALIACVLLAFLTVPHITGRAFALMLMIEGPTRFMLEMLRVEPPVWHRFSLSMIIGACLFVAGIVLWIALGLFFDKDSPTFSAQPALAT